MRKLCTAMVCILTVCISLRVAATPLVSPTTPSGAKAHKDRATFALIIGVNRSVDKDLRQLRYADDDAARYFELFRLLGARTYLLTRMDENTRRLHTQAVAEAVEPDAANLKRTVGQIAADVQRARQRGVRTVLYVVYAGHGRSKGEEGYVSLENRRLTGQVIAKEILGPAGAHESHLIVDACDSVFLALGRGPGGSRRQVSGFSRLAGTLLAADVGMVLSTSSARESHEWEAFQAGVFSHAVRSGMLGAADADGDGQVSYREIAAFVERANAAIPNERYRSRVFARPPVRTSVLVDLRPRLGRHVEIGRQQHGRYLVEDDRGVRLADFHSSPRRRVRLLRPGARVIFIRPPGGEREYTIEPGGEVVRLAALTASPPHVSGRGAAHNAFSRLFELPFDESSVASYRFPVLASGADQVDLRGGAAPRSWRYTAAWTSLGLSAAAVVAGVVCSATAAGLRSAAPDDESQVGRASRNDQIGKRNVAAVSLYAVGGAAAAASLLLFFWPDGPGGSRGSNGDQTGVITVRSSGGGPPSLGVRF